MVVVELLSYRIVIERGALDRAAALVREHSPAHRFAIITDDRVGPLHAPRLAAALGDAATTYTMPAGEDAKTRGTWAMLTDRMLADRLGRDTTVVALGGGVVGDMAGFVAATYLRGIPFVQVPTSLLAMVDASIGGKTGVDTPAGKNLVGAFHQPALVIVDPALLDTLPTEHRRAGFAEVIKHGVIADAEYFAEAERTAPAVANGATRVDLAEIVAGSVRIKAGVVAADVRELGLRKTLNFGHTLGHAIEAASDYAMLHGEAIAIGMVLETRLAERLGLAAPGLADRLSNAIGRAGLPTTLPSWFEPARLLSLTRSDKKARGGRVEYALPSGIGTMAGVDRGWGTPVDDEDVLAVLLSNR